METKTIQTELHPKCKIKVRSFTGLINSWSGTVAFCSIFCYEHNLSPLQQPWQTAPLKPLKIASMSKPIRLDWMFTWKLLQELSGKTF